MGTAQLPQSLPSRGSCSERRPRSVGRLLYLFALCSWCHRLPGPPGPAWGPALASSGASRLSSPDSCSCTPCPAGPAAETQPESSREGHCCGGDPWSLRTLHQPPGPARPRPRGPPLTVRVGGDQEVWGPEENVPSSYGRTGAVVPGAPSAAGPLRQQERFLGLRNPQVTPAWPEGA